MQKITFSDYIRIQINQTGLKQISCVGATIQTPIPLPTRRIKGSDYRGEQVKNEKGRHTQSFNSIHPHSFGSEFIPSISTRQKSGYKICPQQSRAGGGGNADRGVSLQHCSLQYSSNIPIARTGKDI